MEINDQQENYISGYVKIYRSVVNHWLWIEKPYSKFEAWIFLLIRANFKDAKINIGFELFDIKRGQFISSQEKLSEQFGWSRNQVRSFIGLLENDKMIVSETTSKFTKITICNYDTYQSNLPANLQPINNDLTTTLQRLDTNKKDNNNKEVIYNKDVSDFDNTFTAFLEMRKKIKKPATKHAIELIKKKLDRFAMNDESLQIAILNQSILNSWQDVYEIKKETGYKIKDQLTEEEIAKEKERNFISRL